MSVKFILFNNPFHRHFNRNDSLTILKQNGSLAQHLNLDRQCFNIVK